MTNTTYLAPLFLKSALVASMFFLATADAHSADGPQEKVVFADDFDGKEAQPVQSIDDLEHWEFLDPKTWTWKASEDAGGVIEITERGSAYKPPTRSPGHVALVKDLEVGNCEIRFRVRSTKDTGNHRDCCIFFGYQDASHFYYCHLGAKPDPHSGQIMIVNEAPRLALTKNEKLTPWDDQWHTVMVRRNIDSGLIEVFFDDMTTPHMSVTDKTFAAGRVGIGSFDDLNAFDGFTVSTF
ncbi:hypothetical protein AB1L30_11660 [Bremerella sp. JC817]|uniref:hypothetical protein n=1 Tax=Bremerella sp. JC817 TaxID=3231756 RepID=UPI00345AE8C9